MELKKDWSESDFAKMEKHIVSFLSSRRFETNFSTDAFRYKKSYEQINPICGLAYTSTSAITALWVCNVELYFDIEHNITILGFALSIDGNAIAVIEDNLSNIYLIEI